MTPLLELLTVLAFCETIVFDMDDYVDAGTYLQCDVAHYEMAHEFDWDFVAFNKFANENLDALQPEIDQMVIQYIINLPIKD